jgi:hypothetical protein
MAERFLIAMADDWIIVATWVGDSMVGFLFFLTFRIVSDIHFRCHNTRP